MATKSNLLKKVPKKKRRMSQVTVDEQYTGPEPAFSDGEEINKTQIGAGLNYYTYHKNVKDAKKYIAEYLIDYGRTDEAKQVKACPDVFIISTYGWIARMSTRGAKFNVEMDVIERLNKHVEYICKQGSLKKEKTTVKQEQRAKGPTIQDRIKDQSDEMDSQFVQWTDMYVENTNLFNPAIIDPYGYLQSCNCTQAHARRIKKDWETELIEFKEALKGTDQDLKEAYSHLLKNKRMEGLIELINRFIDACDVIVGESKATRKQRKKKPVSVEKQISKLKYKQTDATLGITSVNPIDIIGATMAIIYQCKYRKLGVYVADDDRGFKIKGTTLLNFSDANSTKKTLRKPKEQLNFAKKATKHKFGKWFESEIKTTETKLTGRLSDDTVILQTFK
jgi:hypothetical protein|tara:strand:+ start:1007 stop:2182 length:1176 start_codon:yes stop_codon:yes gene_type:complete